MNLLLVPLSVLLSLLLLIGTANSAPYIVTCHNDKECGTVCGRTASDSAAPTEGLFGTSCSCQSSGLKTLTGCAASAPSNIQVCADGRAPNCRTSCGSKICIKMGGKQTTSTILSACPKHHPQNTAQCCKYGGSYCTCISRSTLDLNWKSYKELGGKNGYSSSAVLGSCNGELAELGIESDSEMAALVLEEFMFDCPTDKHSDGANATAVASSEKIQEREHRMVQRYFELQAEKKEQNPLAAPTAAANATEEDGPVSNATEILGAGPFKVSKEKISVDGWVCGGPSTAMVYAPTDMTATYPLISFAHGFTAGGNMVDADYGPKLLSGVASWGYVIVATMDAPFNYCERETEDQLRSIDFMRGDPRIDWTKKVGVMGHSMGGHATILSSANSAAVEKYNIGAAVALHPVQSSLVVKQPRVPVFFGTGSLDTVVPPGGTKQMFNEARVTGKVIAEISGATHFEPNTIGPNRWTDFAAAYFGCYLQVILSYLELPTRSFQNYNLPGACDTIYADRATKCDLCACSLVPMKTCKHTGP